MNFELKRSALITGSATGIGRAAAVRLAKAGINIAINYSRSEQEAIETQKMVEAEGVKSIVCKADVADEKAVVEMVDAAVDAFGQLDILVNNAGTTHFVPMGNLDGLEDVHWDRIMAVNVKGLFYCCRAATPHLKKQKGVILNVTSVAGVTGVGSSIAYAASKAAAISVTKSLARVLAPDVRVNSIAPGIVMTRWVKGHEDHVETLSAQTPLGRAATAEDVAELIYAYTHHADFITGQNIVIDGGMFM
ncbi:MAG: SDR family oxidoreductase [Rhodothermaceae bacterium]|nr:SDR family oxidoreductase [Rhodothermaceae bacterium]